MNQNITTEVKNRVILFIGGSTQFITEAQEQMIFSPQATVAGGCKIDGNFLNLSSISRIIGRDEYYAQNPNKRPANEYQTFDGGFHESLGAIRRAEVHKKGLESMVVGMKKYIESNRYQGTQAPIELLKMMENKLTETSV